MFQSYVERTTTYSDLTADEPLPVVGERTIWLLKKEFQDLSHIHPPPLAATTDVLWAGGNETMGS